MHTRSSVPRLGWRHPRRPRPRPSAWACRALASLALLGAVACSDEHRSTTQPALPDFPSATAPTPDPTSWTADFTFVAVSGPPDNCMVQERQEDVGKVWRGSSLTGNPLTVEVGAETYRILEPYGEYLALEYRGRLDGLRFAATAKLESDWEWTCADGRVFAYDLTCSLEGSFSGDLASFAATQRCAHRAGSAEVVTIWDWQAYRP